MIVLGLSFCLLAIAGTCLARATGSPDESRATRSIRVMLWAFAILVVTEAMLGRVAGSTRGARSPRSRRSPSRSRSERAAWRPGTPAERQRGSR